MTDIKNTGTIKTIVVKNGKIENIHENIHFQSSMVLTIRKKNAEYKMPFFCKMYR